MKRTMLAAVAVGLCFAASATFAQTMKSVAGTYTLVQVPTYGDKPRGQLILTADGRYTLVIRRDDLKPIAAGSRFKATPEEYKAIAEGSIAHFGSYSIDDGGKSITFNIETSTFAGWDGKPQKRPLTVKDKMLSYLVTAPSGGGGSSEVAWRRR